ncbi:MAG: AAA family ATPase [Prevotella pectinovora]|uniref:AAA family ATPase n=1 Tax=Prevotella pectinovora TaxID=1602169 RepID=UPI002A82A639|nr:AAA family ATPase [Prevotella pectinovora]MDY4778597.1 AAA family ATPase [Prevotella pectinovora]
MSIQEEYKYFIENCTSTPKSYKNYSDFSRICKTFAYIRGLNDFDIYSITTVKKLEELIITLESNDDFNKYNKKGGNQYSNALHFYLRFLKAKEFFSSKDESDNVAKETLRPSLQQIFYGAPGTGKSHTIKEQTRGEDVVRTTFHPDSDYSTFVGAYKPTTKTVPVTTVIGTKAVPVEGADGKPMTEDKIVYEFVSQAFLQAYIEAWQKFNQLGAGEEAKKEYLIIEEINRGNCAQIFGDLFQLLDRGAHGFSEYPIKADADMQKQLHKAFAGVTIPQEDEINKHFDEEDIVSQVLNGEVLLLPSNLYIWATMNTSDQSLFPIDSAFKRRWDWNYVPISDAGERWAIDVNGAKYDWWQFLVAINSRIYDATYSEDKKLGYFFCKAENGVISAEKFVSKVVFYLWNDVFKDCEFVDAIFNDEDGGKLSFDKFYTSEAKNSKVVEEKVALFLKNLGVEDVSTEIMSKNDTINTDSVIRVNGKEVKKINAIPYTIIEEYVNQHRDMTAQEVIDIWEPFKKYSMRSWVVANKEELDNMDARYANYSYKIDCSDGNSLWVNKDGWMHRPANPSLRDTINEFIHAVNEADLGITITEENV